MDQQIAKDNVESHQARQLIKEQWGYRDITYFLVCFIHESVVEQNAQISNLSLRRKEDEIQ